MKISENVFMSLGSLEDPSCPGFVGPWGPDTMTPEEWDEFYTRLDDGPDGDDPGPVDAVGNYVF